jgi:hypothetical protein
MIHPLFAQEDDELGNSLNAGGPADDFAMHGQAAIDEIAGIVAAYGTADDPRGYAERLVHRLFPNVLPYRVGTPASFDFLGWNGRRMTDNATDVMFSLATNHPVGTGVGKDSVTRKPRDEFPYVPAV